MKVKVRNTTTTIEEIDLEYPIYLHFQDELCHDELVAVLNEQLTITVKYTTFGFKIKCDKLSYIDKHLVTERNLTTQEHFYEVYNSICENFNIILDEH